MMVQLYIAAIPGYPGTRVPGVLFGVFRRLESGEELRLQLPRWGRNSAVLPVLVARELERWPTAIPGDHPRGRRGVHDCCHYLYPGKCQPEPDSHCWPLMPVPRKGMGQGAS
eukprot:812623-Rhodomonas_salina.1